VGTKDLLSSDLAVVYAMKQFRHYLLGRPFQLITDHAPLQWLLAQKMEGMLSRWALAMQEYDYTIRYRKGVQNANADALSHRNNPQVTVTTAALSTHDQKMELKQAQEQDSIVKRVRQALLNSPLPPKMPLWQQPPLRRYRQLWSQLAMVDNVLCRQYRPGPTHDTIVVPIIPASLQKEALQRNHDAPSYGHQGTEKTLERLRQEAYWVNMARDVEKYCRECAPCQQAKLPGPIRAPMTSIPIGRPWQMIAVDILEVPLSPNNN